MSIHDGLCILQRQRFRHPCGRTMLRIGCFCLLLQHSKLSCSDSQPKHGDCGKRRLCFVTCLHAHAAGIYLGMDVCWSAHAPLPPSIQLPQPVCCISASMLWVGPPTCRIAAACPHACRLSYSCKRQAAPILTSTKESECSSCSAYSSCTPSAAPCSSPWAAP